MPVTRETRFDFAAAVLLTALTLAVFAQTITFDFVTYDDPGYVYQNPALRHGLSTNGLRFAFTSTYMSNYSPLVWLTYLTDYEIGGYDPWVYHATNSVVHTVNVVLLFLVVSRMTAHRWPSFLVAALFAVHPLHVESVAWVSERKDVLSALFWILALGAYRRYARAPGWSRYALVALWLVLSLLAKPMAVTLPAVFLLLDFWPLRRARLAHGNAGQWLRLVVEKAPLLIIAVAFGAVALVAQRQSGAMAGLEAVGFVNRAANAIVSYARYLVKIAWPADLLPFYPHPGPETALWSVGLAGAFLVIASVLAWRVRARHPYALVGWLWYLGTLMPVLGLVQVGKQAMADRYTYLPSIGVFLAVAWSLRSLVLAKPKLGRPLVAVCAAALAVFAFRAWDHARVWNNSQTLYTYTLRVDPDNPLALANLGQLQYDTGNYQAAAATMRHAVARYPRDPEHRIRLALSYQALGQIDAAYAEAQAARDLAPHNTEAYLLLGEIALAHQRPAEAARHYEQAIRANPDAVAPRLAYGHFLLEQHGETEAAERQFRAILADDPREPGALAGMGAAALQAGDYDKAEAWLRRAVETPHPPTHALLNLAILLNARQRPEEALPLVKEVLKREPGNARAIRLHGRLAEPVVGIRQSQTP